MWPRRRGLALTLIALLALADAGAARATPDAELVAALDAAAGADVVAFDLPAAPEAPHVRAATIVCAPAATLLGVLAEPARYGLLLPSLVRSEPIGRRGDVRVVAWELEVPLFNLSGTLELRPRAGGVELALVDGDLSPGRIVFETATRGDGCTTVAIDARLPVRRSSWFLRQVMARSTYGEPAVLSAATWVALRATALRATHVHDAAPWRPAAPPAMPVPGVPDGRALLRPALARLAARGAAALVTTSPSGHLAGVSVGVPSSEAPATLEARLADPRSWRSFPGWRHVRPVPPVGSAPATVVVEDGIPLVDFDATWQSRPGATTRSWLAIEGATRGAWFGWQVGAAGSSSAEAVFTMAPRLEQAGSIPRRFIAAEPLLEHGLALATAFVDAVSATHGGAR